VEGGREGGKGVVEFVFKARKGEKAKGAADERRSESR
jgi:hypothetical protein